MSPPKRKNIRLKGFDYSSPGGYAVTVCTHQRACFLSRVYAGTEFERARVELTEIGEIANEVLQKISKQYALSIDACVIMPNHIHMILIIQNDVVSNGITVGRFVGAFKSLVAKKWREVCNQRGTVMGKLWQRNYYEHILRGEADYLEKTKYIDDNPDKWADDELYEPAQ